MFAINLLRVHLTFEKVWDSVFVDGNCIHLQTLAPIKHGCRTTGKFQKFLRCPENEIKYDSIPSFSHDLT